MLNRAFIKKHLHRPFVFVWVWRFKNFYWKIMAIKGFLIFSMMRSMRKPGESINSLWEMWLQIWRPKRNHWAQAMANTIRWMGEWLHIVWFSKKQWKHQYQYDSCVIGMNSGFVIGAHCIELTFAFDVFGVSLLFVASRSRCRALQLIRFSLPILCSFFNCK